MDIAAADNQTGVDLLAPPSTRGARGLRVVDVPLLRATAESLAGMGVPVRGAAADAPLQIVPWPRGAGAWRPLCAGTGVGGGEVAGVFRSERRGDVAYSENIALKRRYVIGWYGEDPAASAAAGEAGAGAGSEHVLTHEANYHADGGQIIAAQPGSSTAFVLLLAPPGDDVQPSSFRAFLVDPAHDGITGVHINAGTWHQPAFALDAAAVLDNRQGAVHACAAVSFVAEFGAYLRVPLSRAALALPPPPRPTPPAPPRLGRATLRVRPGGVRAALDFYVRAFRLRERFAAPDGTYGELDTGAVALAFCDAEHAGGGLSGGTAGERPALARPPRGGLAPAAVEVGLVVADVDAAHAHAVAAGAESVAPPATTPWGQRVSYVRDEEGFLVELCGELEAVAGGDGGGGRAGMRPAPGPAAAR